MSESAVVYKTVQELLAECRKSVPTVAWRELPNFIGGAVASTVRSGGCVVNLVVWWDEGRARYGASTFDGTDRSFHSHFGATPDAVAHPALVARVAAAVASRADAESRTATAEADVATAAASLEQARNRVAAARAGQDMAVRDLADAEMAVSDVFGPMLRKAHVYGAEEYAHLDAEDAAPDPHGDAAAAELAARIAEQERIHGSFNPDSQFAWPRPDRATAKRTDK